MALYPCDIGNHPYRGAQNSVYLSVLNGLRSDRMKARLCTPHLRKVIAAIETRMSRVLGDGFEIQQDGMLCMVGDCALGEEDRTAVFATVYGQGDEPWQYFARVCDEHAETVSLQGLESQL